MSWARLIPAAAAAAAIGVVLWSTRREPPNPAPQAPAAPVAAAPEAPKAAAPVVAPTPPPAAAKTPAAAEITFPDGSKAPALNGVDVPVKLIWNNRPFSPITGKSVSGGIEWYVHEDGTHSTVQWTEVNGVRQAAGLVASPTDPLPVVPGAGQDPPQTPPTKR